MLQIISLLVLCHLSQTFPAPKDAVVLQIQQWGVVGAHQVEEQILLNGISLSSKNQEVNIIVRTISADPLLQALISLNQNTALRNHTVLRSRDCILEGPQLHWIDRVFCDGELYLTLDHNDTWVAYVPQALALKVLWDHEVQRRRNERIQLQEGCKRLMTDAELLAEHSVPEIPLAWFLIPLMMLLFAGLILTSLLIAKKQGWRYSGGVTGSIVHYPMDMAETAPGRKDGGYYVL
ncbi:uncharacterized protein KZ484_020258 [Pholidichthys leucotaenia]